MAESEYLTVSQASRASGLSAGHIARLLRDGQLRGIKPGHDWLVQKDELTRYLVERKGPGRPTKSRDEKDVE